MYGEKNKYIIPKFMPAAIPILPLLILFSSVARHIAHWAEALSTFAKNRANKKNTFFNCNMGLSSNRQLHQSLRHIATMEM
jgi:hypothetical protein